MKMTLTDVLGIVVGGVIGWNGIHAFRGEWTVELLMTTMAAGVGAVIGWAIMQPIVNRIAPAGREE